MATIITDKKRVKAQTVRVDAYYGSWVSVEFNLGDGNDIPWTEDDIYTEARNQIGPWLDLAANFGIDVSLEDVREQSYTIEEEA